MATRLLNTQRIVNLASDPGSGNAGEVYYNTVASKLKFYNGSSWAEVGGGSGTVTSVGISVPTGLSVSNSPITSSGTIAISLSAGYTIPTIAALDAKAPLASPALTGTPTAPTAAVDTNTTQIATTAYVVGQGYAKLASPTFTGTVTLPTVSASGVFTTSNYINRTTASGNSSWLQQDGTGRVHWYWNTLGGTSPTFTNAGEDASAITQHVTLNGNGGSVFFRSANGVGASAGGPITWTTTLYVDLNTITFKGTPLALTSGATFTGTVVTPAATTSIPSIRLPHGTAPTSPTNGDIWTTTSGLFARINGTTEQYAKLASPTFTTPNIGVATGTSFNSITGLSSTAPVMDGTAAVGTGTTVARADHVHPTDTTRAALASPTFTGTPAAPTAAVDTNTTQIATTAFVLGQASSTSPAMNGTAAVGTSTRYARADHVHASDTSRAPLASPTFTGTPAAPTAAADTNTTQIATTAYVIGQGYAKLASPSLTGTPTAPTAAAGTNTTQIATTAYVTTAVAAAGGGGFNAFFLGGM